MRARLLITYPAGCLPDGKSAPFVPTLIIEAGQVGMFTSDWVRRFENVTLDSITENSIRDVLRLDDNLTVYLTPPRPVPDTDLFSETVSLWRQQWWLDTIAELRQHESIAKAS